ncbi:DUF4900 domain-containing protein [Calidithermus chliarophilus]|uniref:DUF4900 domain-containing protein n=1 Tax=Calidithermus chliarophilus TaxID=52023 RepID=UPI00042624C2|nr:DUF4900 domain-containing protein [Calidithermus chliarophilus]
MRNHGLALITALVLLTVLVSVITILFVGSMGDLQQSRSSVQLAQARAVAEAGETYARYALAGPARSDIRNAILPLMSATADPYSEWVIPQSQWSSLATTIQNTLNTNFGSVAGASLGGIGSATVQYSVSNLRGLAYATAGQAPAQTYVADYVITSTGRAGGGIRRVQDKGIFQIQLGRPSLSQWLFLVDDAEGDAGFFPTGTVFNGPVHANHAWGFWGTPVFRDVISTSDDGAYYYNANGRCGGASRVWVRGDSRPPCTVPRFEKGFIRSAPEVDLPNSTLSQQRAALGMDPLDTSTPSNSEICFRLGLHNPPTRRCNSSPSIPDGVYLVNDGSSVQGGIYVQGNLDQLKLEASGDGKQVYTLRQGSNTWVITADYAANTTSVRLNGGPLQVFSGVPNGHAPLGSGGPTGQIYVTGRIDDLRGPGRSGSLACGVDYPGNSDLCPDHPPPDQIRPALSKETQLNITAVNKIGVTSDLIYECDPTKVADGGYTSSRPRCVTTDGLVPTVLGVFSQRDHIVIEDSPVKAPDNIYLWGSFLAGASGKGLAVENYGGRGKQGKMHVYGGVIQSSDQLRGTLNGSGGLGSGYIETYDYDLRFANSTLAPPNFPTVRSFDLQTIVPVKMSFREY